LASVRTAPFAAVSFSLENKHPQRNINTHAHKSHAWGTRFMVQTGIIAELSDFDSTLLCSRKLGSLNNASTHPTETNTQKSSIISWIANATRPGQSSSRTPADYIWPA
jgi:hypothetical protein